jgi:heme exporter protein A
LHLEAKPTMTEPSLQAKNLTLIRGGRSLFTNLDFTISRGEALVLRGANGSGKTSLLRVLAGLTIADAGVISWGDAIWKSAQRANVLYLGHANALKDELTTAENLADGLNFDGVITSLENQHHALKRVGLISRRDLQARRLSQGQKRRIGLARLLLAQKPVWLLDEPTNALDAEGVALFTDIVDEHLARGGMACVATHLTMQIHAQVQELNLAESA